MILLAIIIGVLSAAALLLAGHQIGLSKGSEIRDELQARVDEGSYELRTQLGLLARLLQKNEAVQQTLEQDMKEYFGSIAGGQTVPDRMRTELRALLQPLMERERANDDMQQKMHELLGPLMQRERLGLNLAQLDLQAGQRQELPRLLDNIAESGGFSVVLLSDEAGLPLSSSSRTENPERYAGLSSLLMGLIERLSREAGPNPLAVAVYHESNHQMLSRVFEISGQRLMLTAVTTGGSLSPVALDPALAKLETVLAPRDPVV
jgi:hypothetical protein